MQAAEQLAPEVGTAAACCALNVSRAAVYRRRAPRLVLAPTERHASPRALAPSETQQVLEILNCERFVDQAPPEVHATLLDEGVYHCSVRTMYRILKANDQVRERRDILRHPSYAKPELFATAPNRVWSWDITKLLGPATWTYFYLYVILDIFSRYVVGWVVADGESTALATTLIKQTYRKQGIVPGQLGLHADRGSAMKSHGTALLLSTLGVTKTHSRPHVSDDNPFSEAQFKTLKYRPDFPDRFGSIEDARAFCRVFFTWYNQQHHHSGIAHMTPHVVHHGLAIELTARRQRVLVTAYLTHPERFVKGTPASPAPPTAAWINRPATSKTTENESSGHNSTSPRAPGSTIVDPPMVEVPPKKPIHDPAETIELGGPITH